MNKRQTKNKKHVDAPVSFAGAVKNFWIGYFDFRGRATRREYWYAWLFVFLLNVVAGLFLPGIINSILDAISFLPIVMVSVRRYRDAGVLPWFFVVPLIVFTIWGALRQSMWLRLIALDYFAPDFIAFSALFVIWFIANIVVCCLPTQTR